MFKMATLSKELLQLLAELKAAGPPYKCPKEHCTRLYKSFSGIKGHLINCQSNTSLVSYADSDDTAVDVSGCHVMSWLQAQQNVEISISGRLMTLKIDENYKCCGRNHPDNSEPMESDESKQEKRCTFVTTRVLRADTGAAETVLPSGVQLNSKYRAEKAPPFTDAYIRLADSVPGGVENDDSDNVEYDMDDEDSYWLQAINKRRIAGHLSKVSEAVFEYLIDRLEKESYFQSPVSQAESLVDDDAVCCVCNDGECENTNVILFCDMCNLAVHQECYGVPYIPEGQWLCKRCLLSPSEPVPCCLCPNLGGAMKQTTDERWAHVACALWIPEVHFSNSVFLEPIDGIHKVPVARRRLVCYICKQRDVGACIQCNKSNCYTAFHVTCALSAGLHLKFEMSYQASGSPVVRKTAFCDAHTPDNAVDDLVTADVEQAELRREQSRQKMRKARKVLAEKRMSSMSILLPTIPSHRLNKIISRVKMADRKEFYSRLQAYWTLKRRSRSGVPLLRRLQICQQRAAGQSSGVKRESSEVKQYAVAWNNCRTSLEMGRLILELLRKREKMEMDIAMHSRRADQHALWPSITYMLDVLDSLDRLDEDDVFAEPVDCAKVRGYKEIIKHPMDLSTMRNKTLSLRYADMGHFQADFNLMVNNCLKFNQGNQYFYDQGLKMKRKGGAIVDKAVADYAQYDFSPVFDDSESDEQSTAASYHLVVAGQYSDKAAATTTTTSQDQSADSPPDSPTKLKRLKKRRRSSRSTGAEVLNGLPKSNGVAVMNNAFGDIRNDVCSPKLHLSSPLEDDNNSPLGVSSPTAENFLHTYSPEPFDLVWARRNVHDSWLPGILIDSKMMPPELPVPSEKVLNRRSAQRPYLIYFLHCENTWHWLAKENLRPLGLDSGFDDLCLRQTVKLGTGQVTAAYQRAIQYRSLFPQLRFE